MTWDRVILRYCHLYNDLQASREQATSHMGVFFFWEMTSLDLLNMSFLYFVTFPQLFGVSEVPKTSVS